VVYGVSCPHLQLSEAPQRWQAGEAVVGDVQHPQMRQHLEALCGETTVTAYDDPNTCRVRALLPLWRQQVSATPTAFDFEMQLSAVTGRCAHNKHGTDDDDRKVATLLCLFLTRSHPRIQNAACSNKFHLEQTAANQN